MFFKKFIPGHGVLQQRFGGHADRVQPPACEGTQHRKAAVLVLAARALHWAQHKVPGREHRSGKAQCLEVVRKVGGLGLAGGHDAQHPAKVLFAARRTAGHGLRAADRTARQDQALQSWPRSSDIPVWP